jgi:hypothetical protein
MEELTVGTRIDHDRYGEGIISKVNLTNYEVFFETRGKMDLSKRNTEYQILGQPETSEGKSGFDISDIEEIIEYIMDKHGALNEVVELGEKWHGGTMSLQPANLELKPKEIPVEVFFHKIVMLRDRLRVLEQNINSNEKLNDEDKVNLQQYITRSYGSLTTFNILFSDKENYFKGAGK